MRWPFPVSSHVLSGGFLDLPDYNLVLLNVNSVKIKSRMSNETKVRRGRPSGEGDRGAATRAAILDAAERRFADEGFNAARLQDIAADVGKTAPAIAHFFKDKLSLYGEVIRRLSSDWDSFVEKNAPPVGSGGVNQVMMRIEYFIRFARVRPALLGFILRDMADGRLHPLSEISWTHMSGRSTNLLDEAVLADGIPPSSGAVSNITAGPSLFFLLRTANVSEAEFEAVLQVHLDIVRRALNAILTCR
jgi:AcrR family transcriptional regulator